MDPTTPAKAPPINRWLPYWAVLQADLRLTLQSWVYRLWLLVTVVAAVGHLVYHLGLHHQAGLIQHASVWMGTLLRWTILGSLTLIIMLTAGSISGERGTLADSILSRGISRYQYFLGKWHARLAAVLGTFLVLGLAGLAGSYWLLHEDLSPGGSAVAILEVAVLLAVVSTCGVTVSAVSNSTIMAITVVWVGLYGAGFLLSMLPEPYPSPDRALDNFQFVLRGSYDLTQTGQLLGGSVLLSLLFAAAGMYYFSRRDV